MTTPSLLPDANVRSAIYLVARATAQCPNCGLCTRLLALALPRGHETLDPGSDGDVADDDDGDFGPEGDAAGERDKAARDDNVGVAPGAWQLVDAGARLFYVVALPVDVRQRLQQLSPHFRLAHSEATQTSYWANHCEYCSALLEDHELHCEPEGAFTPCSEAAAAAIELLRISEPFQACASGYAVAPEFLDFQGRN